MEASGKNVSSSIAGAGSGDFHVYRVERRKELQRIRAFEQDEEQVGE